MDLCSAYRYLHEELHLLHGYLTLQTVLIRNTKLVVSEFSQAEYLQKGKKVTSLKGKRYYMSPQMLNCEKYGLESDIWALGIMFIELLFHKPILSLLNFLPAHHPQFPDIIINQISNVTIRRILKDMLTREPNRINIKEVQERFMGAFAADPLKLKEHNQYIELRNFSTHSCLVKDLTTGNVFTLKKYILPK